MFPLRRKQLDIWYTLLLVGIGATLTGLVATILVFRFYAFQLTLQNGQETLLHDINVFYIAAPLASALLIPCLWWRLIIKPSRLNVSRGIGIGLLGSIIAHPLAWYLALLFAFLLKAKTIGSITVGNPLENLVGCLFLSLFSLIEVGWITILVGGLAGGCIAFLQSKCHCSERWQQALSKTA